MAKDYPNGWKDGWSSADHADKSYSPYADERARIDIAKRNEIEGSRRNEIEAANARIRKSGQEAHDEYVRAEAEERRRQDFNRNQGRLRGEAISIIVKQKRDEYNKKSWFGRAIATLKGKKFNEAEVRERAEADVHKMNPRQLEAFVNENGGRTR